MTKILLLEDSPYEQERLTKVLEESGFEVLMFENPTAAESYLHENTGVNIDAIVSDWNMGRFMITGLEFLIILRSGGYENCNSPLARNIPFTMCSAHKDQNYIDRAIKNGANFYQKKSSMYSLKPMINFLKQVTSK